MLHVAGGAREPAGVFSGTESTSPKRERGFGLRNPRWRGDRHKPEARARVWFTKSSLARGSTQARSASEGLVYEIPRWRGDRHKPEARARVWFTKSLAGASGLG